jgi:hypothetical protein
MLGAILASSVLLLAMASTANATPRPALPHDKSQSPATDLEHNPKRPAPTQRPQTRPATGAAAQAVDVQVVQLNSDGSGTATLYTPAPGVSPSVLVDALRRHGAPANRSTTAVGETSTAVVAVSTESCSYGTARSLGCPPLHWRNNGYSDPQVYFNDHAGANWPTDAAVYTWNQSYGIDSYYRWNSCSSAAGTHCVNVWDANAGPTKWAGRTTYSWDSGRNLIDGSVYVQFNDYYSYNADGFRQNACHELGHALGLGHNVQDYSCMWYQIKNSAHRTPDPDDFNMLATVYSVVR